MTEQQPKLKRQIEILGLCINGQNNHISDIYNLALFFDVEEISIKRDLRDLRSMGVDIHSTRKRGLEVKGLDNIKLIKELMLRYTGLCYSANIFDKSTSLLIEKKKMNALEEMALLQMCIDRQTRVKIKYQNSEHECSEREINPLLIFHSDKSWRVLSQEEEIVKQYHLDRIKSVELTEKKFNRMKTETYDNMFKYSFGSWIGTDQYHIKLKLNKTWSTWLKGRMIAEDQIIKELPGGEIIFSATVNSLYEISSWVVSRGYGCEVLEPEELRNMVIEIAEGVLENYKKIRDV